MRATPRIPRLDPPPLQDREVPLVHYAPPSSCRRTISVFSEIEPPEGCADLLPEEKPDTSAEPHKWPEGSVVVGIIDFGIAFAHERFRLTRTSTRIEHLWVQDGCPAPGDPALGDVPYGREATAGTIDAWLSAHGGCTDEDALYGRAARVLGRRWLRSVSRRMGHGTHVLDLAAGYSLDKDERNKRPIVCVQLPEATVADTSAASLDSYVLDGIRFILQRADEIASRAGLGSLPVVINFSSGEVAGPHDGSSDLEQAMDELIEERSKQAPLGIVISAGNSHLGRLHARLFDSSAEAGPATLSASIPEELHWHALPDDRTPSFLEIWLPHNPPKEASRVRVRITPPGDGQSSEWIEEAESGAGLRYKLGDSVLCEARYQYVDEPTKRGMFLIVLQPTTHDDSSPARADPNALAPSGTWIVTLENTGLAEEPVEAWLQWDDTPIGFLRRGRQSYFANPCYERFDCEGREILDDPASASHCPIKRAGSMNAIATGRHTVVVGGYVGDFRPASYSAGGPITPAYGAKSVHRLGPDMMAVSDDSIVHLGVLAAGTRSGSVVSMSGTSVAAPQITRKLAKELAK